MEYWSVEKRDINPLVISPTLQYSNTPKLIESVAGQSPRFKEFAMKLKNTRDNGAIPCQS
jgi:hypothetical protein